MYTQPLVDKKMLRWRQWCFKLEEASRAFYVSANVLQYTSNRWDKTIELTKSIHLPRLLSCMNKVCPRPLHSFKGILQFECAKCIPGMLIPSFKWSRITIAYVGFYSVSNTTSTYPITERFLSENISVSLFSRETTAISNHLKNAVKEKCCKEKPWTTFPVVNSVLHYQNQTSRK